VRSLVAKLPPEMEKQIGSEMIAEVELQMNFVADTNRVAKLATIAAPLVKSIGDGKMELTFYIAEEEAPNAFAFPGGHVVVTTGLLKLADRPEELLGVISHEVAHVTQKHGIRKAIAAAGPFLIFQVFLGGGNRGMAGVVGGASDLLIRQSFSQDYETEADDLGWQALVAAKIDPRGMTGMFEKLEFYEHQHEKGFGLPRAFASHPALEKRIARLEKKWRKLPEKMGFLDLSAAQPALKAVAGP
jgi:predicted Zn-dependent protease